MTRRAQHGFTLIELLVVLALASMLLTLVPGAFEKLLPGLRYRATLAEVGATLREARAAAVSEAREVAVLIDLDARTFGFRRGDGRQVAGRIDAGLDLKLRIAEGEQLSAGSGHIRFFPDGSSSGGRIVLGRAEGGHRISVDWLTGRVSVFELAHEG